MAASAWRLALMGALAGGVASAQDASVKKPRRPQPAAASSSAPASSPQGATGATGLDNAAGAQASDASAPNTAGLSPPPLRGLQGLGSGEVGASLSPGVSSPGAPPVLRSAVRSRWSTPPGIATRGEAACRAQCATTRIACLAPGAEDDAPRCNAGWTGCLSTCDGLAYGRAPAGP